MRKRRAGLVALVSALVLTATATAAPKGHGLESFPVTCDGQEVEITVSGGASFWLGDRHYVVKTFTGTFTPEAGTPETFTQTYGQKKGLAGATITCTALFVEPGEGSFEVLVTAAPVPPG